MGTCNDFVSRYEYNSDKSALFHKQVQIYESIDVIKKCLHVLGILFLVLQYFGFIAGHIELWCSFATNN